MKEKKQLGANETAKVHDRGALIIKRAQTKRSDCMLLLTERHKRGNIKVKRLNSQARMFFFCQNAPMYMSPTSLSAFKF